MLIAARALNGSREDVRKCSQVLASVRKCSQVFTIRSYDPISFAHRRRRRRRRSFVSSCVCRPCVLCVCVCERERERESQPQLQQRPVAKAARVLVWSDSSV